MSGFGRRYNAILCVNLVNQRVLLISVGFALGLCCSQFLFLLNFSRASSTNTDIDDYCLRQNKWGGLRERLAEQKRIFKSVRHEYIEVIERLDESRKELERLQREIPLKKHELNQLELKIEELKLAARELKDRRNVRLHLPYRPLWPTKQSSIVDTNENNAQLVKFKSIESTVDFSRCSISTRFRIYIYPRADSVHYSLQSLYTEFLASSYRVDDPTKACLFVAFLDVNEDVTELSEWRNNGQNHLLVLAKKRPVDAYDYSAALVVAEEFARFRRSMDMELFLDVRAPAVDDWTRLPALLPYDIKYLMSHQSPKSILPKFIVDDLKLLAFTAPQSLDAVFFDFECLHAGNTSSLCATKPDRLKVIRKSAFTLLFDTQAQFQQRLYEALEGGSIPVFMSTGRLRLPFDQFLDWRLAAVKLPLARLPELHFILRSFALNDQLEMRRQGRLFLENHLLNSKVLCRAILSSIRFSLQIPGNDERQTTAEPAFASNFSAPNKVESTARVSALEDEYLGPVEPPIDSASYNQNMTSMGMYSHQIWNNQPNLIEFSAEFLTVAVPLPSGVEFDDYASAGMRPIPPGSGQEFNLALGGNRIREHFTVIILTHDRDQVLYASLERLNRCPYLNRVLVIWNNLDREPPHTWPKLHVPLLFIRANTNSLNNRFLPYDQIQTEAVLSLDDDIDLKQYEIVMAFRVWRENRDRIVGFPARYHTRYGSKLFYNSNHTCQFSMILTGAAFLHKSYLYGYTHQMPAVIRQKIDEWMNCEDLAMNFYVSHITRKPPIKTTSKWTFQCPTCTETLSQDDNHFQKRHSCIQFFIDVYGYNPLMFTQFRADSVLFKTRVPNNHQKCYRFV